jgi:chaperonin GroEL
MSKRILFSDDARKALKEGIDEAVKAVKITIGPRGQNVILSNGKQTNDGVSVARDLQAKDPFKQAGIEVIQDIAESINERVGDATSSGVVIGGYLADEGYRVTSMGVNAMMLRKGMQQAFLDAKDELQKMAKPIKTLEELKHPAIVSSESEEIGTIIAETVWKTGKTGYIKVEESSVPGVTSEVVEGFGFDKGVVSPYMYTDPTRGITTLDNVPILVSDKAFHDPSEFHSIILHLINNLQLVELVIIADDFSEAVTSLIVANRIHWFKNQGKAGMKITAIKAAGIAERKREFLEDVCVMTKATIVSNFDEEALKSLKKEQLGIVKHVESKKDSTLLYGANKKGIIEHIAKLQMVLEDEQFEFKKDKVRERIAKVAGGIAVLKVGAASDKELKYLKDKIEDCVNSTKHALEGGVIAGGGSALAHVSMKLSKKESKDVNEEFSAGYKLVVRSLREPLRAIAENSEGDESSVIVNDILTSDDNWGYNAATKKIEDLVKKGIVDPFKVISTALEVAVSNIGIYLTTGAVNVRDLEKEL